MGEQKLSMKDEVLKLAELVSTLTQQVSEMKAQKFKVSGSVQVEVTGTDNQNVIKFVKSIYGRKKYNREGRIKSINVDRTETTKGGHLKVFITKTFNDGVTKTHPIIMWRK